MSERGRTGVVAFGMALSLFAILGIVLALAAHGSKSGASSARPAAPQEAGQGALVPEVSISADDLWLYYADNWTENRAYVGKVLQVNGLVEKTFTSKDGPYLRFHPPQRFATWSIECVFPAGTTLPADLAGKQVRVIGRCMGMNYQGRRHVVITHCSLAP